jgi:hypothetical protein
MEDLEEYDKTVENDLNYIKFELKRVSKKKGDDRSNALKNIDQKLKTT